MVAFDTLEAPLGGSAHFASVTVAMRNGEPPAFPEGARRDAQSGRGLAALVLALDHELEDAAHQVLGKAPLDEPAGPEMLLDVTPKHLVEVVVWRQRVLVRLVLPQLRRRRTLEDAGRDQLAAPLPVQPARQGIDRGLREIADG